MSKAARNSYCTLAPRRRATPVRGRREVGVPERDGERPLQRVEEGLPGGEGAAVGERAARRVRTRRARCGCARRLLCATTALHQRRRGPKGHSRRAVKALDLAWMSSRGSRRREWGSRRSDRMLLLGRGGGRAERARTSRGARRRAAACSTPRTGSSAATRRSRATRPPRPTSRASLLRQFGLRELLVLPTRRLPANFESAA